MTWLTDRAARAVELANEWLGTVPDDVTGMCGAAATLIAQGIDGADYQSGWFRGYEHAWAVVDGLIVDPTRCQFEGPRTVEVVKLGDGRYVPVTSANVMLREDKATGEFHYYPYPPGVPGAKGNAYAMCGRDQAGTREAAWFAVGDRRGGVHYVRACDRCRTRLAY